MRTIYGHVAAAEVEEPSELSHDGPETTVERSPGSRSEVDIATHVEQQAPILVEMGACSSLGDAMMQLMMNQSDGDRVAGLASGMGDESPQNRTGNEEDQVLYTRATANFDSPLDFPGLFDDWWFWELILHLTFPGASLAQDGSSYRRV